MEADQKPAESTSKRYKWAPLAFVGLMLAVVGGLWGPIMWRDYQNFELVQSGAHGAGRVVRLKPTGWDMNEVPEYQISLDVETDAKEHFDAVAQSLMRPEDFVRLQPGAVVEVRYDPKDRRKVAIVRP